MSGVRSSSKSTLRGGFLDGLVFDQARRILGTQASFVWVQTANQEGRRVPSLQRTAPVRGNRCRTVWM